MKEGETDPDSERGLGRKELEQSRQTRARQAEGGCASPGRPGHTSGWGMDMKLTLKRHLRQKGETRIF